MKKLKYKKIWISLGLLYVILVIYFCLIPGVGGPPSIPNQDKVIHFITYALCSFWFSQSFYREFTVRIFIWVFFLGTSVELAQGLTKTRFFEYGDILANSLGNYIGLLVSLKVFPKLLEKIDDFIHSRLRR